MRGRFQHRLSRSRCLLCITATGDTILIHGIDDFTRSAGHPAAALQDTIMRFMEALKASDTDFMTGNETLSVAVRKNPEAEQRLVNTQRQLKKPTPR